jgi:hypothetical protein
MTLRLLSIPKKRWIFYEASSELNVEVSKMWNFGGGGGKF